MTLKILFQRDTLKNVLYQNYCTEAFGIYWSFLANNKSKSHGHDLIGQHKLIYPVGLVDTCWIFSSQFKKPGSWVWFDWLQFLTDSFLAYEINPLMMSSGSVDPSEDV